ncbi:MAG: ABC transporter permease [Lentisphaeria bacterium]|nr:ABC transporter permease [Lentisphaeria bacterium]
MRTIGKIIKYEVRDILRSKFVLFYFIFFLLLTEGLLRFGGGSTKTLASLSNVVLLVIPLMAIIFGAMYLYHSREFTELLLTQPVNRHQLFTGLYLGLAVPLGLSFGAGLGLPFLFHGFDDAGDVMLLLVMIGSGVFLTFIFTALAFWISVAYNERVKGLGISIVLWLFFAVIYDGLVLLVVAWFADYPLEKAVITFTLFNPLDLARILLLLQMDASALMGYTGAGFQRFFGSFWGISTAATALMVWTVMPFWMGMRKFTQKDF